MVNVLAPLQFSWGYAHHIAELLSEKVDALDLHGKSKSSVKTCKLIKDRTTKQSRSLFYGSLSMFSKTGSPRSPTPDLLLSNNPPIEHDISMITDAICQAEMEAERLAEQLTRVHGRFSLFGSKDFILFKHEKVSQFISDHKAVISPIRRIPSEILQEIFIHAVHAVYSDPWTSYGVACYSWHHVSNLPFGISQVSVLWRRTAINTPALWQRIPTVSIERKFTVKPRYLAFLTEILSRTRHAPLELYIHGPEYMASNGPHPAIELLISHSMRWKSVVIEVPSSELSILNGAKSRLASLEKLVILGWYFISPSSDIPLDTFRDAPLLYDVRLFQTRSKIIDLPYSQLVYYREEDGHARQCNNLFASTPSTMRNLSLEMYHENQIDLSSPIVALSNIVVLKLRLRFYTADYLLLRHLFLPALEELLVDSYYSEYSIETITSLVTREGRVCPLKKLYLRCFTANHGELVSLLRQTPHITHLSVDIPSIDDLQSLIHPLDYVLLPSLENCSFYSEGPLGSDHIDLCRMFAETRCEQQHPVSGSEELLNGMYARSEVGDTRYRALRAIYIHYPNYHTAESQQKLLQRWPSMDLSLQLRELRVSILERFPEVDFSSAFIAREIKGDARFREQTPSILTSIRDIKIHDIEDIYASGIHRTLFQMGVMFENASGLKQALSQLSKQILGQWETMLNKSLSGFRWMILDSNSLLYVPSSHRIRTTPESTRRLIFGDFRDEDFSKSGLAWPSYTEWET